MLPNHIETSARGLSVQSAYGGTAIRTEQRKSDEQEQANRSGTFWYYGVGQANRVHGWVGANWLALVANGPQY